MPGPFREHFTTRKHIAIIAQCCVGCKLCMTYCPVGTVIKFDEKAGKTRVVDPISCGGCCSCLKRCPSGAIRAVLVRHEDLINDKHGQIIAPGEPRQSDKAGCQKWVESISGGHADVSKEKRGLSSK